MELQEFAQKLQRAISEVLGEEYQVSIQEVEKNNGVLLQGLLIHAEGQNVSPTIYLEAFWRAYENGVPLADLVQKILQIYREDTMAGTLDMSFFKDFRQVKDRICYRLVHGERNSSLLEKIPHIPFLDLAICFFYAYEEAHLGNGMIMIHNSHVELWQTEVRELLELAGENTRRIFPWECKDMDAVLGDVIGQTLPMKIVSNHKQVYGAACLLYPGICERLSKIMGGDFYILPSSVHELIVLPDMCGKETKELKQMIYEVNRTQLEPEEVLSDSLYYYDSLKNSIRVIE